MGLSRRASQLPLTAISLGLQAWERSRGIREFGLRRANEAKDEFLGLVSHELRTPITSIYGGSRILRMRLDQLDEESRHGLLADIEQESERLNRIVEDLLVLARMELGETISSEPVMISRIIERVAALFRRRRPSRQLDIMAEAIPPVEAEPTYLEQVLRSPNLLLPEIVLSLAECPKEPLQATQVEFVGFWIPFKEWFQPLSC